MATTKVSTKLLETVGVAEGGTGATSTSAARTSLGLVIGTNVLAPNGSAASLSNLPAAGATDAENANIMLNAFRISVNGGLSVQNMVDGVVDEFEDETGIDTSTSTNETYDTTSDFYSNLGLTTVTPVSGSWQNAHSSLTLGTGTYDSGGSEAAVRSVATFTGNFEFQFTLTSQASYGIGFGFYESSEDGTYNNADSAGGMQSMTDSWLYNAGDDDVQYGSTNTGVNFAWTNGDIAKLTRVGGIFKIFKNGTSQHQWTQTSTNTVRLVMGSFGACDVDNIQWIVPGTPPNMTLFSNATTALAAPDDANIVIWQEDVDSITLNTDLKAYASRNGGTTYTQMTLAEVANLTTGRILTGTVDISGQSSATAMKYKIETLNTEEQKIHAVALQWS